MEPEFVDEERIPLIDEYGDDYDNSFDENADESVRQHDTSFIDGYDIPTDPSSDIQGEAIREKDKQINALERNFNVKIPREQRARFRLTNGYLQVENNGSYINLTKSNGEFLAESTLRGRLGASLARNLLGIETPKMVCSQSRRLLEAVPTEIEMEDLSPQRLVEVLDETTKTVSTNTDLDMREFLGIDEALTRIKGELENSASKLSKIDEHLEIEQKKLAEVKGDESISDETRKRIKKRIADLKKERSVRLEILSQNKQELASQFSRIRQTVEKILDEDLTLREKIKLVFREHGLTITAVLTAFGLIISTIITSLTGGRAVVAKTAPPKNPNKVKKWFKNKLKALARLLGRLASKAASVLPGIIGSIISGILNFLKKVVTTASEHVWLFITSIATLIGYRILYPPSKAPNRKKR